MHLLRAFTFIGLLGTARAEWTQMPWPDLDATLPIWKPDDFNASKSYPAIVFYHGTDGKPTAEWIQRMTAGKDFVLVGMTYRHRGRFDYTEQEIADELGTLNALKKTLIQSAAVDPKRVFVGGFSKGGWHTSLLLDRDRTLAGGLILGAGVFEMRADAPKFTTPVPIYIGCGRNDGNYPPSLGALLYFRKLGAQVTQEVWPDTAHEFPDHPPEALRQWLRIQATPPDLVEEAHMWISARLPVIETIADPVEQWFAWDEFIALPFVKNYEPAAMATAQSKMTTLLKDSKVAAESKWRQESRRLLALECRDRLVTTLQEASRGYEALAANAAGTRAGAEATRDVERTHDLLRTAKVVTRPTTTGTLVPEKSVQTPSSGPDRGAFFPPGTKFKK